MEVVRKGVLGLALAIGIVGAVGCAGARGPRVNVLGVSDGKSRGVAPRLMLIMEVHNPLGHPLVLSGFDYSFQAERWFSAAGSVELSRVVLAGSSALVEVPVPESQVDRALAPDAEGAVKYRLEGSLRAVEGPMQVHWNVSATGEVPSFAGRRTVRVVRAPIRVEAQLER